MPKKNITIIIFSIAAFSFHTAFSQTSFSDSVQYHQAIKSTKDFYKASVRENLMLYNGSEYGRTGHNALGFPFFETDSLLNGSIFFNNNRYEDENFQYDIVIDKLVLYDYKKSYSIILAAEQTKEFIINGHHFFYLQNNPILKKTGYYEKLVDGPTILWARREKKVVLSANAEDRSAHFTQFNDFFVQKNNSFYPVDNESSFTKIMDDRKDEIKKYIRNNKMKFRKQFEESVIKVLTYYNQSIH